MRLLLLLLLARHVGGAVAEQEVRRDPIFGGEYTLAEFVEQYGDTILQPPSEWLGAVPKRGDCDDVYWSTYVEMWSGSQGRWIKGEMEIDPDGTLTVDFGDYTQLVPVKDHSQLLPVAARGAWLPVGGASGSPSASSGCVGQAVEPPVQIEYPIAAQR